MSSQEMLDHTDKKYKDMKTRIQWLDIAKGIAIILMVLGHTSIPKVLSNFIWAFHMPLFFIAAGYSTQWNKLSIREYVIKKTRTLIIPFIAYSIIILFIFHLIGHKDFSVWLKEGWKGYALWFIPVLYLASLLTRLLQYSKKKIWSWAGGLLLTGGLLSYSHIDLPWTLNTVPYAAFLMIVGDYMKKYNIIEKYLKWWWIVLALMITVFVSHFWRLDLAWNQIRPVLPLTLGAIAGTVMVFMLSLIVNRRCFRISSILTLIGRETYLILAFSQIIIMVMNLYTTWNAPIRYLLLIIILVTLKHIKDFINKLIGFKLFA